MENIIKKLQDWVLSWDFVRFHMYTTVYKLATDDVLKTNIEDIDERAEEKAKQLLNDLLSPVEWSHVMTINRAKQAVIGGVVADEARLLNLKSEARFFMDSELWKLLIETPKELAHKALFVEGENIDTMRKGRTMLYTLKSQENIIKIVSSFKEK